MGKPQPSEAEGGGAYEADAVILLLRVRKVGGGMAGPKAEGNCVDRHFQGYVRPDQRACKTT